MTRRTISFLLLAVLWLAAIVSAQNRSYEPKQGSAERKAIVDALREPVQQELKKKAIFKIDHLRVQGNYAFLRGVPLQPDGSPMNYADTPYQQAIADEIFDDGICALLKKEGGRWQVVTYVIGATDVPWVDWDKRFKAPAAIFG